MWKRQFDTAIRIDCMQVNENTMNKKEKLIKKSLMKAVNSVRKKFRALHNAQTGEEFKNVQIFKPITGKLDALIDIQSETSKNMAKDPIRVAWNAAAAKKFASHDDDDDGIGMQNQPNDLMKLKIKREKYKEHPYGSLSNNVTKSRPSETIAARKISRRTSGKYKQPQEDLKDLLDANAPSLSEETQDAGSAKFLHELNALSPEIGEKLIIARSKAEKIKSSTPGGSREKRVEDNVAAGPSHKYARKPEKQTIPKERGEHPGDSARTRGAKPTLGSGIIPTDVMRYSNNTKIAYTYWDDPNELVNRLRLLIASKSASHSGHANEIISIIEELREADIIE